MLRDKWKSAVTLDAFIAGAEANQEMWQSLWKRARVPDAAIERLQALPAARHLLVILEDWCGDAVNTTPVLGRLAEQVRHVELRVLRRDENLELMDRYLSGNARAIPVVIVLDEHFRELGWWGSRPAELKAWLQTPEAQAMEKADRYREMRRWYSRDQGRSTLDEVVALMERTREEAPVPVAAGLVA